jgi:erythromycin esterase-like protein
MATEDLLVGAVADRARPLTGTSDDFAPILDAVGQASCVLIGEATHGTHEFYRLRAQLTKLLIEHKGFAAVAAEADWPDAYRVNRYVQGLGDDGDAVEALADFRRFPAWMWRNADVLDFVGWLRAYNDALDAPHKVGFYGLDLYSLHASVDAVISYLEQADPEAARWARYRYGCFDHFGEDPQQYGYATSVELAPGCAREVVTQLVDLQRRREALLRRDGIVAEDEFFQAEQNARVVKVAEAYYRSMFRGRVASWNLRDTHMADTLDALLAHLGRRFEKAKVVVWAHNSHVGDASATELGDAGEVNIGQLARLRHPGEVMLVGFSTYSGTVTAASDWGTAAERMEVRPALPGSYEQLFHDTGLPSFLLMLRDGRDLSAALREPLLQRAIGVIYKPQTERLSHYFQAKLAQQFDALLHIDRTRALEPLERTAHWELREAAETFPSGM